MMFQLCKPLTRLFLNDGEEFSFRGSFFIPGVELQQMPIANAIHGRYYSTGNVGV